MKLLFWLTHETHSSPVPRTCKWAQWLCMRVSGTPSLQQAFPRLNHVHCTLETCKYRLSWSGNCHRYSLFLHSHTLVNSHTQYLLFTINYKLKYSQGTLSSAPTPGCVVCIQWWSLHGISWESRAGLLSPRTVESGLGGFSLGEGGPIFMFPC
jgi:hypothetical protein